MAAACKSCHARVIWVKTSKGKAMPIDAVPVENGNIVLEVKIETGEPIALYVDRKYGGAGPFYTSHFATCPNAAHHRRTA